MSFFVNLLKATRPHTYPLSLVGVLVGNAIAWTQLRTQGQIIDNKFWLILSLTLLTAVSLQILSNLANDYGDGKRGTDAHRTDRHFGDTLSPQMLMNAIIGFVGLICVSGLTLLVLSLGMGREFWGFLGLGACAIIAAITALAAIVTRIMAIPQVSDLLTRLGLGPEPPERAEQD